MSVCDQRLEGALSRESGTIRHGGRLFEAVRQYGIPLENWLDLSTGLNPFSWPVPSVPAIVWQRLPEPDDGLMKAAEQYYGTRSLLPVAGSQAAIQALPLLRASCRVGVLTPGYAEHAKAWHRAGHSVMPLRAQDIESALPMLDVLVIMNPNNPTGERFTAAQLSAWHCQLADSAGWLVVDEAFMDMTPADSLLSSSPQPGLIVLRSLGKFFGLAGVRVGFVWAQETVLAALSELLGPWTVSTPARWIAQQALSDASWQEHTRTVLSVQCHRLRQLLNRYGLQPDGGCDLFQWVRTSKAKQIEAELAQRAILIRRFDRPDSLRFGLPGEDSAWIRLQSALACRMI